MVDWLGFTFHPDDENAEPDCDLLLLASFDWVRLPYGRNGYRSGKRCGGISVYWAGATPGMGWHVEMSGSGCRELEAAYSAKGQTLDWSGYVAYLMALGCGLSRLDAAIDDRAGYLAIDTIRAKCEARELTSNWKTWRPEYGAASFGESPTAPTLYLGSTRSDSFVRIYDKEAEQASKGKPTDGHWVRCELQTRDARAEALGRAFASAGNLSALAGILRGLVEFRERSGEDSNASRWDVSPWWDAFLGAVERIALSVLPKVQTVDSVREWVRRQVAPSLAVLMLAAGGDLGELAALARDGLGRLRGRHQLMLSGVAAMG